MTWNTVTEVRMQCTRCQCVGHIERKKLLIDLWSMDYPLHKNPPQKTNKQTNKQTNTRAGPRFKKLATVAFYILRLVHYCMLTIFVYISEHCETRLKGHCNLFL